jgi:hypothetical protein
MQLTWSRPRKPLATRADGRNRYLRLAMCSGHRQAESRRMRTIAVEGPGQSMATTNPGRVSFPSTSHQQLSV